MPFQIDQPSVASWLLQQPGMQTLHDLRIWPLSTARTALAVHSVCNGPDPDAFIDQVSDVLAGAHAISDVTLQLERHACDGGLGILCRPRRGCAMCRVAGLSAICPPG